MHHFQQVKTMNIVLKESRFPLCKMKIHEEAIAGTGVFFESLHANAEET